LRVKQNRKRGLLISLVVLSLLISVTLLAGCTTRGMTPVGWAGIIKSGDILYTASKQGMVVSIKGTSLNSSDPITTTYSGNFGCGSTTSAVAIYGTPAIADGLVFIAAYNGEVDAYNPETLEQRWVYPRKSLLKPIIGSLIVDSNTLYFGCTDGSVYGLDTTTGDKKWQFTTGGELWSTPAIDNNTLFIGSFDKKIYAIDIPSQSRKWVFSTQATNVAPPVVYDGIVYAGSLDRTLYAINESDGTKKWSFTGGNWFWAKPVIYNGTIFAPNLDNHVYGLDLKTGEKIFDYNVEGQVASWSALFGNQVVVATESGKIYTLSTDRSNQNKKLVAELDKTVTVTSPLYVEGDSLYINGSDNQVYKINLTSGQKDAPINLKQS
jgi:outer membrane protein assembly factor BamB